MARPVKVTDEALIKSAEQYLKDCKENNEIPIIREFALINGLSSNRLYERAAENQELSTSIKKIADTKQVVLERGALTGKLNPTMAIFSLKQMGWSDHKDEVTEDKEDDSGIIMIPSVAEAPKKKGGRKNGK